MILLAMPAGKPSSTNSRNGSGLFLRSRYAFACDDSSRQIAVSGAPKLLPQGGQRNSHCTAAEYQNFAVLISFHVVLQAHHARWKNIGFHQSKCGLVIDVFEQGKTLPQQYRIYKQPVPVDEIFRHQRMSGGGAAKNQDFAARAVLE